MIKEMAMALSVLKMDLNTMDNGKIIKDKELERLILKMDLNILDLG